MQLFAIVYVVAMLGTLAYALVAGGASEQAAAWINCLASVASWFVVPDIHFAFGGPELGFWALDTVASGGLFVVAVRSRSYWPIWAFAFSAAAVASTIARTVSVAVSAPLYWESESAWPYLTMAAIMIGTAARRRPWMTLPG